MIDETKPIDRIAMAIVSIIIPTFNRSSLLKECVDSLLAQTYHDLEIIIVDDGSTDDTQATIAEIAQKHNNVRYYLRPHLGASAARNFGLTKATGEFIGFFDSDDLWPPNYVETMVKCLQARPDFGMAYSKTIMFGEEQGQYWPTERCVSGTVTVDLFTGKLFILPSAAISRRSIWKGFRWEETLQITEDRDIFLRISTVTRFIYVPDVHAMRRKSSDTVSAMVRKTMVNNMPRVMERFYFCLGGNSYIPRKLAFRKISHRYRGVALAHYRAGYRSASMALLKKALSYQPLDLRLYLNLFRAFILNPKNDKMPDWQIPPALGKEISGGVLC